MNSALGCGARNESRGLQGPGSDLQLQPRPTTIPQGTYTPAGSPDAAKGDRGHGYQVCILWAKGLTHSQRSALDQTHPVYHSQHPALTSASPQLGTKVTHGPLEATVHCHGRVVVTSTPVQLEIHLPKSLFPFSESESWNGRTSRVGRHLSR